MSRKIFNDSLDKATTSALETIAEEIKKIRQLATGKEFITSKKNLSAKEMKDIRASMLTDELSMKLVKYTDVLVNIKKVAVNIPKQRINDITNILLQPKAVEKDEEFDEFMNEDLN